MVPPLTRLWCDVLLDNKEFPLTFVSVHITLSLLFFSVYEIMILWILDGTELVAWDTVGDSMDRHRMYF